MSLYIDDEEKADDNQTDLEMKSIEARCITPSTKDKEADDGKAEMNEDKSSENSGISKNYTEDTQSYIISHHTQKMRRPTMTTQNRI